MNEEVLRLYQNLESSRKKHLEEIFQESPKTLLFIEFLANCDKRFKTPKAVNFIYKEELEELPYTTLVNRYYKLRQSLKEWLLAQLKHSSVCFTAEEQELAFLRLLVVKNQFAYALDLLKNLEKKCWEANLFEILPEVLQLIIRCIRSVLKYDDPQRKEYQEKFKLAIDLLEILQTMQYKFQYIYSHPDEYQSIIASLRREIKKHKQYHRFTLLYHYIAFSTGVFLPEISTKSRNALSRHINQYEKLSQKHKNTPITYFEPYHREKIEIDLCLRQAMFDQSRLLFKRALKEAKKHQELTQKYDFLHPPRSENRYLNLIYVAICGEGFDFALKLLKELELFYEEQELDHSPLRLHMEYMNVYNNAFPSKRCPNPKELEQGMLAYIEHLRKVYKGDESKYLWALAVLMDFHIIHLNIDEAERLLQNKQVKKLHQELGIWETTHLVVDALARKDRTRLLKQHKLIKTKLEDEQKLELGALLHYKWLANVTKYYVEHV